MNSVALIGRLTADPELKTTQSGSSCCRFTLAVNRIRKSEGQPDADFIRCAAFGKTAESLSQYMRKGNRISVEGRIQTGSYMNQQGQKIYTTDILANHIDFLESRKVDSGAYADPQAPAQSYSAANPANQYPYPSEDLNSAFIDTNESFSLDSNDLPF